MGQNSQSRFRAQAGTVIADTTDVRRRAIAVLFLCSGALFLAGVLDPPLVSTWGQPAAQVIATAERHRTAWFTTTWLITLSIVCGLAAVELLAQRLGTGLARLGASIYLAGSVLGLASTTYDLAVTSKCARRRPDARLVLRRPAVGRRARHRVFRPPRAARPGLPGSSDRAHRCATELEWLRLADGDGSAARPVRRLPRRATGAAVPSLRRRRYRRARLARVAAVASWRRGDARRAGAQFHLDVDGSEVPVVLQHGLARLAPIGRPAEARSVLVATARKARASMASVVQRCPEFQRRTWCWSSPTRPLADWNDSSMRQRCPATRTTSASDVGCGVQQRM
jgi:hypothetical protein